MIHHEGIPAILNLLVIGSGSFYVSHWVIQTYKEIRHKFSRKR